MTTTTIHTILALASLVPSSHNCQPWQVIEVEQMNKQRTWLVGLHADKVLNALPSLAREMYISLGGFTCVLANLLHWSGWQVSLSVCSDPDKRHIPEPIRKTFLPVYCLSLFSGGQGCATHFERLSRLLQERQTYRGQLHETTMTDCFELNELLPIRLPNPNPLAGKVRWRLADVDARNEVATLMARYATYDFSHSRAWKETYHFIDFSSRKGDQKRGGFNIAQLMGPMNAVQRLFYQVVLSPHLMWLTGLFGLPRRIANTLANLVKTTHLLYIESDSTNGPLLQCLAGECMIHGWLTLTHQGFLMHPVSVLLQHDDSRHALTNALNSPNEILFLARVGVAQLPLTTCRYRWPVESFFQSLQQVNHLITEELV